MNHRTLNRAALVSLAIVAAALLTLAYSHKARAAYADIGGSSPTATIAPTATPTTPNPTVQTTRTPVPTPTTIVPIYNPIVWRTETVSLEANNFYVIADGKVFLGNTNMQVRSDPGNANYTTLEATWQEGGVEMRLNLYFVKDSTGTWEVTEARTYNGRNPGNWIFYPGFRGSTVWYPYSALSLDLTGLPNTDPVYNVQGRIHFGGLRLQAFTNAQQPAPTNTVQPTPTAQPTTTVSPPVITSVKRFHEDPAHDLFVIEGSNFYQEHVYLSLLDDARRLTVIFAPNSTRMWTNTRIEAVYEVGIQGKAVLVFREGNLSNFSDIPTGYTPVPTTPTPSPTATRTPAPTSTPSPTTTPSVTPQLLIDLPRMVMQGRSYEAAIVVETRGLHLNGGVFTIAYPPDVVVSIEAVEQPGVTQIFEANDWALFSYAFGTLGSEFADNGKVATLRLQVRADIPVEAMTVRRWQVGQTTLAEQGRPHTQPAYSVPFGISLSGDADGDGAVTILDFSLLASSFNKAAGQPGFDARADFNQDRVVSILDFSLLASNFNRRTPGMG